MAQSERKKRCAEQWSEQIKGQGCDSRCWLQAKAILCLASYTRVFHSIVSLWKDRMESNKAAQVAALPERIRFTVPMQRQLSHNLTWAPDRVHLLCLTIAESGAPAPGKCSMQTRQELIQFTFVPILTTQHVQVPSRVNELGGRFIFCGKVENIAQRTIERTEWKMDCQPIWHRSPNAKWQEGHWLQCNLSHWPALYIYMAMYAPLSR